MLTIVAVLVASAGVPASAFADLRVSVVSVACPAAGLTGGALVETGTGDDVVDASVAPVSVELSGGAGDDRLTGGASRDVLTAGAGADALDDDRADPVSDCEVVAPEWDAAPELSRGPYEIGRTINAGAWGVVATGPPP